MLGYGYATNAGKVLIIRQFHYQRRQNLNIFRQVVDFIENFGCGYATNVCGVETFLLCQVPYCLPHVYKTKNYHSILVVTYIWRPAPQSRLERKFEALFFTARGRPCRDLLAAVTRSQFERLLCNHRRAKFEVVFCT